MFDAAEAKQQFQVKGEPLQPGADLFQIVKDASVGGLLHSAPLRVLHNKAARIGPAAVRPPSCLSDEVRHLPPQVTALATHERKAASTLELRKRKARVTIRACANRGDAASKGQKLLTNRRWPASCSKFLQASCSMQKVLAHTHAQLLPES